MDQGAKTSGGRNKATPKWYRNQKCRRRRTGGHEKFTGRNNNQRCLELKNVRQQEDDQLAKQGSRARDYDEKGVRMKRMIRMRCNKKGEECGEHQMYILGEDNTESRNQGETLRIF